MRHVLLSHGGEALNVEEDESVRDLRRFVQLAIAAEAATAPHLHPVRLELCMYREEAGEDRGETLRVYPIANSRTSQPLIVF
jgi:hypothetical protein